MESQAENHALAFPVVKEEPVSWGIANIHPAFDHKAIVNPTTGKVFSIVSKDYRLIRHEDAIEQVEQVIGKYAELGRYFTCTEFYNDKGRMRRTYHFPDVSVEIRQRDRVNLQIHLLNSYDAVWMFMVLLGAFRLVCSNGLVVGKKFLHLKRRHVYGGRQADLEKEVSTALGRFESQTKQWAKWTNRRLTPSTRRP